MNQQVIGRHIIEIEQTTSTNTDTANLLRSEKPTDGTVIIAYKQTAGRGQDQNQWESEPYQNLTFSILLYPLFLNPGDQFQLSKTISLGIIDFLKTILPDDLESIKIKWPNDIYVQDKKICGILIQNSITGNYLSDSIVGIGLNVNQTVFKSDAPNPVSISNLTHVEIDLRECLSNLCKSLDHRYSQLSSTGFQQIEQDYLDSLYRFGQWHKYKINNDVVIAKIKGVSEFGQLLLQGNDGNEYTCNIKEVTYLL